MSNIRPELKEKLKHIPAQPGIYKMYDSKHHIIYIGKSKCLKNRVKSYFVKTPKWEKVIKMVSLIYDLDYVVTDTHLEARLLECELIKTFQPIFNSQMKNDKRYVYLKVNDFNIHNPLSVVLEREDNAYGPFRSRSTLLELVASLKNIYPIIKCKRSFSFDYHIFPEVLDKSIFGENRDILLDLFSNEKHMKQFIHQAEKKMKEAATNYQYEIASKYRDIITGMNYVQNGIDGYQNLLSQNILLKLTTNSGYKLFFVSKGNIVLMEPIHSLDQNAIDDFIIRAKKEMEGNSSTLDERSYDYDIDRLSRITRADYSYGNPFTDRILTNPSNRSEKANMDFRDIIYSEILSLPEEMVMFFPK